MHVVSFPGSERFLDVHTNCLGEAPLSKHTLVLHGDTTTPALMHSGEAHFQAHFSSPQIGFFVTPEQQRHGSSCGPKPLE